MGSLAKEIEVIIGYIRRGKRIRVVTDRFITIFHNRDAVLEAGRLAMEDRLKETG